MDSENLKAIFGDMPKKIQDLQDKNRETLFNAKSGGGMVSVSMNGMGELVDLSIDDSLLKDKRSLEVLLISAINEVYKSVEENKKSMAMNVLGGLGDLKNFGL